MSVESNSSEESSPLLPVWMRVVEISEDDWDKLCKMEVPAVVKRLRENPRRMMEKSR